LLWNAVPVPAWKPFAWSVTMAQFYVYLMASRSRVLYVGVTNDLEQRVRQHKQGSVPGFTARYHVNRLVWYEVFPDIGQAIETEKRIKGWLRARKIALVDSLNPDWKDLAAELGPATDGVATAPSQPGGPPPLRSG
jgi:putative endonuclease